MNSLVSMIMVAGMMGMLGIPLSNIATQVSTTTALSKARILYEAEIDRLRRLWTIDQQDFDIIAPNHQACVFNTDDTLPEYHGYRADGEGFNANVSCTIGRTTVGGDEVILAYPESDKNPGQYQDLNLDGFEDTTGLPTHYDQCYAGWKGDGFKHNACDIGMEYVIPMYQEMYDGMNL